jgi:hypothetical protein
MNSGAIGLSTSLEDVEKKKIYKRESSEVNIKRVVTKESIGGEKKTIGKHSHCFRISIFP